MYQVIVRRYVGGVERRHPVYLRSSKSDEYQARPLSFARKLDAHAVAAFLKDSDKAMFGTHRYEVLPLPEATMRSIDVKVDTCGKDNVKVAEEIREAMRGCAIFGWHGCADALTELNRLDDMPAMWSPMVERCIAHALLQARADAVLPEYDGIDFVVKQPEIVRIGEHPFRKWLRQTYSKGAIFGEVAHFLHADEAQAVESGMNLLFVHGVRVYVPFDPANAPALVSEPVCSFETNDVTDIE